MSTPGECRVRCLLHNWLIVFRNTITVGIFYALPACQLILSEQMVGTVESNYWSFYRTCGGPHHNIFLFLSVVEDQWEWRPVLLQLQVCHSLWCAQVRGSGLLEQRIGVTGYLPMRKEPPFDKLHSIFIITCLRFVWTAADMHSMYNIIIH